MTERERRVVSVPVEAREDGDEPRVLSGYAALYAQETVISGAFREVIRPGAFRSALTRGDDVRALFNHDPNVVLGRTAAGTLSLIEDERGLRYTVTLPDTQAGRDLWVSVKRGDITQSSFAFSVEPGDDDWPPQARGELPLRIVLDVRLYDVSPVTYPAYGDTSVAARSAMAMAAACTQHPDTVDWRARLETYAAELATVYAGWRR